MNDSDFTPMPSLHINPEPTLLRSSPFLVSLITNAAIFAATYALFSPRFLTNDDVHMLLKAAGVSIASAPTESIPFSNILLGKTLAYLYARFGTDTPFYALYLVFTLFAGYVALLFAILKNCPTRRTWLLYLAYFALVGIYPLLELQFTVTAAVDTATGLALLWFLPSHT